MSHIGDMLYEKRVDAKLTQTQLAKKLGVRNFQLISRIENGKQKMGKKMALRFARVFKLSALEITSVMSMDYLVETEIWFKNRMKR